MKKFFSFISIFCCVLLTTSYAQSWNIIGNSNTDPATNFLGTTNKKDLVFKTNNAERMRILQNGKIGIGITNPKQVLDVKGNINIAKGFSLYMENHKVLQVDSVNYNTFLGNGVGTNNQTGVVNTAVGYNALYHNITGFQNSAYGYAALAANEAGNYNTAIGVGSLFYNNGSENTATGVYALNRNTSGSYNTASGTNALYFNTTGGSNTANGAYALNKNVTGSYNTANGYSALNNNTGDNNTAIGAFSLVNNTTGAGNIGIGKSALFSNTTGNSNTVTGFTAMYFNTTGSSNVAFGSNSLGKNTTGSQNVALGDWTLYNTTSSWSNTAIGYNAGGDANYGYNNTFIGAETNSLFDLYNTTAIGMGAHTSAANQVRIGNSLVSSIGGYTSWTNISDGRVKKNIRDNVPGLAFINKLKPVTYNLDLDAADKITQKENKKHTISQQELKDRNAKQQIVYTGFVAQDVEKAAKELSYDFSGVDVAKNDKDLYGLRYAEFVVPIVKAIQELSKMNDEKDNVINDLKEQIRKLESLMNVQSSVNNQRQIIKISSASLEQNVPNPFNSTTKINYILPKQYTSAKIIITDKLGKTLKEVNVSNNGSLDIDASTFSSGTYQYSLVIDKKIIDTKQMVLMK